jgi:hypothetical protein
MPSLGAGKSKGSATSSSGNVNNGALMQSMYGATGATGAATNLMGSLLGGNTDALNKFADSGGMKFLQEQGQQAVTSSKAAQGLLNSGSYGTALQDRGQQVARTYLNDYMNQLTNLGQLGIGAGGVLANSGDVSNSSSHNKSKNGSIGVGQ